ncbi:hypothetical protein [Leptospira bourretii]|nr:hypothetical protein [Leptospira bourretii]
MSINYYCTLFDSNYLLRGVTMLQSLAEKDPSAKVFVFPFDNECYESLQKLSLSFVQLISLKEFESPDLLRVKEERSKGEYCWTCTPWIIRFCLDRFQLDHCTYVDADLFFFSNPQVLLDEAENSSVLITEHRYSPAYDQSATAGIYCVQFVFFRSDVDGLKVLHWWADRCLEWCYSRIEDGKFGDQKYLDHWTTEFNRVHVLKHLGGGVAPWNVQQYEFDSDQNSAIVLKEKRSNREFNLIFYHFHDVKVRESEFNYISDFYDISKNVYLSIYSLYSENLKTQFLRLKEIESKMEPYNSLLDNSISGLLYKRSVNSGLLAESYLYHLPEDGDLVELGKYNFEISPVFKNVKLEFPVNVVTQDKTIKILCLLAKGVSFEVQIDQILVTIKTGLTETKKVPISLFSFKINGNWQKQRGNCFSFFSNHGYFEFTLEFPSIEKIELIGKWRSIGTIEAANEISRLNIFGRILKKLRNLFL